MIVNRGVDSRYVQQSAVCSSTTVCQVVCPARQVSTSGGLSASPLS